MTTREQLTPTQYYVLSAMKHGARVFRLMGMRGYGPTLSHKKGPMENIRQSTIDRLHDLRLVESDTSDWRSTDYVLTTAGRKYR